VRGTTAAIAGLIVAIGLPAAAQSQAPTPAPPARPIDQKQSRYEISQMERLLEGAVEHGLTNVRERVQRASKAQSFVAENLENAHVRGFRLDGYGVFFDIEVPSLQGSLLWSLQTLDQNDLGLTRALQSIKEFVDKSNDINLQQALKRIELQMPVAATSGAPPAAMAMATDARLRTGSPATAADTPAKVETPEPTAVRDVMPSDWNELYRTEIQRQIQEAMVSYSSALALGADEWLTVGARGHVERPLIAPADSDQRTVVIKIRGTDLRAVLSGQITREEAIKRMEVRVF
jgi:hypothetical protein